MNLADNLTEITELAKSGVIQAVAFMKAQMPELVEQIFSYYTTINVIGIVVSLVGIIASIFGLKEASKRYKKNSCSDSASVIGTVSVCVIIAAIVVIICNSISLIQISIAPKLFLIEYIKGLM